MMMTGIYEYNIRCEMIVELLPARKLTVEFRYIYVFGEWDSEWEYIWSN